jgi:hypothetical protein
MTVLRDFPIQLTAMDLLQAQRRGQSRTPRRGLIAAAEEAVALANTLIDPAAVCAEFPVRSVVDQQVVVSTDSASAEERTLHIGPKVDLIASAERLMVTVYTIGEALERRVRELNGAGENLASFLLDSAGVMALDAIGEALRERTERQAAERGWGVSPALSPGSLVGWPIQGQREVCALLPLGEIGVRLSKLCVLEPHKSVSMVIGSGANFESTHTGSVCEFCSLADSCWQRQEIST